MTRGLCLLCVVSVIGCGRIAFDPSSGSTGGDGGSGTGDGSGSGSGDSSTPGVITWESTQTATVAQAGANFVDIPVPSCLVGDVAVAAVAMGSTGAASMPTFTPPDATWTLIRRLDSGNDTTSALYWHVITGGEPAMLRWSFSGTIGGVAWMSCYDGVDTTSPIDVETGVVIPTSASTFMSPSVVTTVPNAVLLVTFMTHGNAVTWTPPPQTTQRANVENGSTRSGVGVDKVIAMPGATGMFTATSPQSQSYALVHVTALRPGP